MKHLALSISIFVGCSGPAMAQAVDCTDRSNLTQLGLNQCAALDFQTANAALAGTYARALATQSGPNVASLEAAHNAWLAYRYLTCDFEADQALGGSIAPLLQLTCMTRLTERHTADLDQIGRP